ncbi:MAG TPA: hypothetical protein VKU44_09110 [Terriglobia bacterium]|nr:hypothetical protein [Terriglobia bacterium]
MNPALTASAEDNLVPLPYSRISVQEVDFALNETRIQSFLLGKEAYFETDYIVLRRPGECAIAAIRKAHQEGLFCPITGVEVIALPDSCRWIDDPSVDTGIPSALAEKARALGVAASETLVVNGLYEHVNFIHRPRPLVIDVFDLFPPGPPRLLDMTRRVLAYKKLPAIVLNPRIQSIPELVRHLDGKPILFPCRVSELKGIAKAFYLDERPRRQDWVLAGCERSRRIHHHFYGDDPPRIELCPKKLFVGDVSLGLMRCCMVEKGFEISGRVAVVPWGAEPSHIEDALQALLECAKSP